MHWLEEWMRSECSIATKKNPCGDCTELCAPCMILSQETGAYVSTIKKLALEPDFITGAALANRIAQATGATADQRDMLVNPIHHGEWKPDRRKRRLAKIAASGAREPAAKAGEGESFRAIVMIDTTGRELKRFAGMAEARVYGDRNYIGITNRCDRKLAPGTDEFLPHGTTYRWADEWDGLTDAEKQADIQNQTLMEKRRQLRESVRKEYVWKGKSHTVAEWARIANLPEETLRKRLKSGWDFETAIKTPVKER